MTARVLHGDCLDILPTLDADSFHSVCCDPPYHLTSIVKRFGAENSAPCKVGATGAYARASSGFMGKQWDGGDIAFRPETWAEVYRVMKPGAFLAAFASTRGYHRMACAIEDAGFIIHPMLSWIFGTGFPKATRFKLPDMEGFRYGGQVLKPAMEPICFAQKPMIGTGNENWLEHGVGGINIDACRIEYEDTANPATNPLYRVQNGYATKVGSDSDGSSFSIKPNGGTVTANALGRWPANVLHDGSDEVMAAFAAYGEKPAGKPTVGSMPTTADVFGKYNKRSTVGGGDVGSAARFFYSSKADSDDRAWSKHPTVKPIDLIRWLSRLITPPGGHVLDLFAGSGTTGEAALLEGFNVTLIEQDATYIQDINRRLGRASGADTPLFA